MIKEKLIELFPEAYKLYSVTALHFANNRTLKETEKLSELKGQERVSKIEKTYEERMGHKVDLSHPESLTEKIQWRKAYDANRVYAVLSDKYAVREWIEKKLGKEYLIPLLGVWENSKDIDFDSLPNAFVLKTNNGSHTNAIVTDKSKLDIRRTREDYRFYLKYPYGNSFQEYHYNYIKPLIIAEQFMKEEGANDLVDYKFHCYDGEPYYCEVFTDRSGDGYIDLFDMDWNHMEYNPAFSSKVRMEKPEVFEEMKEIVQRLSAGFAYVRTDLYYINGRIYFGEMTFTPAGGYDTDMPRKWDIELGKRWDISKPQVDPERVGVSLEGKIL